MLNIPELINLNQIFQEKEKLNRDNFNFISQLGAGAFGKVYRVKSNLTQNEFAMKVLDKNQIKYHKLEKQLQNEIKILAICNHPNIIQMYGVFEENNYIFMLLEICDDGTLFDFLRKKKFLSENACKQFLKNCVEAVQYLHSQNPPILHRDIKPENILISKNNLKIADFGWSHFNDDFRNTFCGTPDYSSPEMILGTGHDEKNDIWCLGVLFYELLHGKAPFTPQSTVKENRLQKRILENNILEGKINFKEEISIEAKDLIKQMLSPDKEKRPYAKELINFEFFQNKKQLKKQKTLENNDLEEENKKLVQENEEKSKEIIILKEQLTESKNKQKFYENKFLEINYQSSRKIEENSKIEKLQKDLEKEKELNQNIMAKMKQTQDKLNNFYKTQICQQNEQTYQKQKSINDRLDQIFFEYLKLKQIKTHQKDQQKKVDLNEECFYKDIDNCARSTNISPVRWTRSNFSQDQHKRKNNSQYFTKFYQSNTNQQQTRNQLIGII